MNRLSPFKQGFLGGLTALVVASLLFIMVIVVAQDDGYDATKDIDKDGQVDVLDVQSVAAAWNSSGSPRAPLIVFNTTATYNGSGPAEPGRTGMNEACRAEDPAAHFCSCYEIEEALRTTGVSFRSYDPAWVDCFFLGTTRVETYTGDWLSASNWDARGSPSSNPRNCLAWTTSSSDTQGWIIDTAASGPSSDTCDTSHALACCK